MEKFWGGFDGRFFAAPSHASDRVCHPATNPGIPNYFSWHISHDEDLTPEIDQMAPFRLARWIR